MKFPIGAMSVGDILDRGLKLFSARLPAFFVIMLMMQFPSLLIGILAPIILVGTGGGPGPDMGALMMLGSLGIVVLFAAIVLGQIGMAAILHIIAMEFVDQPVDVPGALGYAMSRFLPLLGVALLAGLVIGIGFILCVVPGIIFLSWFGLASQVVVVEQMGAVEAMGRSKQLTEGFRGRVIGLFFLVGLIQFLLGMVLGGLELVIPSMNYQVVQGMKIPQGVSIVGVLVNETVKYLVTVLVQIYSAICITLLYFDLRIRKEGFDLQMLARQ